VNFGVMERQITAIDVGNAGHGLSAISSQVSESHSGSRV
jgi:hypothetical protein